MAEDAENLNISDFIGKQNITDQIDGRLLEDIGFECVHNFEIDENDFQSRKERITDLYKLALQAIEEKNYPFPKASNVKVPILTKAAISFASMALPAIIQDDKIAKGRPIGNDSGTEAIQDADGKPLLDEKSGEPVKKGAGDKQKKADRIATFLSYQTLEKMESWEDEMDKLLHIIPIVGIAYKKVYYSPIERMNISKLVLPQYLIINIDAENVYKAERVSELFELKPCEIEEHIRAGLFKDFQYETSQETLDDNYNDSDGGNEATHDETAPHVFIEMHTRLDLDEDGYSEPYVVFIHKDTKTIVRILPRFEEEDVRRDGEEIIRITPQNYFVEYPFIPDPEGSPYAIGFGQLLQHLNVSINTSINQMIDQGHRYTMGGGFIGQGPKIKGGELTFRPGEWKRIQSSGMSMREAIVNLPMPEPSQVLFLLMQYLTDGAEDIAMMAKAMSGDVPANVPATTMLAIIEQAMQPFKAVIKRVHRSLKKELKRLFYLNKLYLDEQEYMDVLDDPNASIDDFNGTDVVPVSDPDIINNVQALVRAQALLDLKDDPLIDGVELRKRVLKTMNIKNVDDLVRVPPQQVDEMAEAQKTLFMAQISQAETDSKVKIIQAQIAIDKSIEEVKKIRAETLAKVADAESKEKGTQLQLYDRQLDLLMKAKEELNGSGSVPSVENPAGNSDISQVPTGQANDVSGDNSGGGI